MRTVTTWIKKAAAKLREKIRLILTTPDATAVQARAEFDA
jgi:hypothetical protein